MYIDLYASSLWYFDSLEVTRDTKQISKISVPCPRTAESLILSNVKKKLALIDSS